MVSALDIKPSILKIQYELEKLWSVNWWNLKSLRTAEEDFLWSGDLPSSMGNRTDMQTSIYENMH